MNPLSSSTQPVDTTQVLPGQQENREEKINPPIDWVDFIRELKEVGERFRGPQPPFEGF